MNEEVKKKVYNNKIIKSPKMAGFLLLCGFELLNTGNDKYNPGNTIYWFKNDAELQKCIDYYGSQRYEHSGQVLLYRRTYGGVKEGIT